jgi:hypothetical protein
MPYETHDYTKTTKVCIKDSQLSVEYCPMEDMLADMFTKTLQGSAFMRFRDAILNVSSPATDSACIFVGDVLARQGVPCVSAVYSLGCTPPRQACSSTAHQSKVGASCQWLDRATNADCVEGWTWIGTRRMFLRSLDSLTQRRSCPTSNNSSKSSRMEFIRCRSRNSERFTWSWCPDAGYGAWRFGSSATKLTGGRITAKQLALAATNRSAHVLQRVCLLRPTSLFFGPFDGLGRTAEYFCAKTM